MTDESFFNDDDDVEWVDQNPENAPDWDDDGDNWDDEDQDDSDAVRRGTERFQADFRAAAYELDSRLGRKLEHGEVDAISRAAFDIAERGEKVSESTLRDALNQHYKTTGAHTRVTDGGAYDLSNRASRHEYMQGRMRANEPEPDDRPLDIHGSQKDRHEWMYRRLRGEEFEEVDGA